MSVSITPKQSASQAPVAALVELASASAIGASSRIPYDTTVYDTHGGVTLGASFTYTIPVSGYYSFNVSAASNGATNINLTVVGGANLIVMSIAVGSISQHGSVTDHFTAGATVYIGNDSGFTPAGGATVNYLAITCVARDA